MSDLPSDEMRTGLAAEEHKNGFRPMPERPAPKPERLEREFGSSREALREIADNRRENRKTPEAEPVFYGTTDGKTMPENRTVKIDRAAEDLTSHREGQAIMSEIAARDDLARKVDKLRADAGVPTDPNDKVRNQVDPTLFGDLPHQAPQIDPQHMHPELHPTPPAPPGIDPEVHRAMQLRQVREHFEQEHGKVTQLQQQHAQQVQVAQDFAQAAFRSAVPELANLRPDQIVPFLNQMAKTNPPRFKQAMALLDNVAKANTARQQVEQRRVQAEQQQFQRYAQEQDKTFDRMMGQRTPQQRQELATEMVAYAAEMGIDRSTLLNLMKTNPIMRHAGFQRMMAEATAARLAQKQLAAMRQQQRAANIPPVIRPGTSNGGGVRAVQSANLQALSAKLNQTGDAKDAAALLMAMRSQRRR
jgi:hypothetical protein